MIWIASARLLNFAILALFPIPKLKLKFELGTRHSSLLGTPILRIGFVLLMICSRSHYKLRCIKQYTYFSQAMYNFDVSN